MSASVEVVDLFASRRTGFWLRPVETLRGVSLTVRPGSVHGLVGQNGAGKSTTIQHIVGLARPHRGRVRVGGGDPREMAVRRRLAYQPEQPAFPATLTCAEVVRLHAALVGDIRCSDVLERCGLGERRQTPVGSLSKGQQTRLSLALTLLGTPEVFVLDEPMSGLDPLGRDFVRGLVREHAARGATVLFSSHALADVEALCDSITVIHGGRVLLDAPVHDLGRGHGEDVVEIAVAAPPDWRPPDDLFGERNGALWVTRTTQDPLPIASRLVQSGGQIVHLLRARPRLEDVVIGLLREAPGP